MYGAGGIARIVDSATDNEDGPVETRRTDAQRQEKEEDDYDGEQAAAPEPKMRPCHQGSHVAKSCLAFRNTYAKETKRRRTVSPPPLSVSYLLRYRLHVTPQGAPQAVEKPVPGGVDATHPGANADDQLAENPVVLEQLDNPAIARESTESEVGIRKWVMPKARRLVSLSPYQTRARSRLHACTRWIHSNHPEIGCLLIPAKYLLDWDVDTNVYVNRSVRSPADNISSVRAAFNNSVLTIWGTDMPVFLYDDYTYNPDNPEEGLFRGQFLVCVSAY
jgi:hypothetical protein